MSLEKDHLGRTRQLTPREVQYLLRCVNHYENCADPEVIEHWGSVAQDITRNLEKLPHQCEDCEGTFAREQGRFYKYEPVWLCDDCDMERMEED